MNQKKKFKIQYLLLPLAAVCLVVAVWLLWPRQPEQKPPMGQGQTVIHLAAGGDVNLTAGVLSSGNDGDFTRPFMDIAGLFAQADCAIVNLEGNLHTEAGFGLAQALRELGIDFAQTANSATLEQGISGMRQTISRLEGLGIQPLGSFADMQARQESQGFTIQNIGGIRVAFVAFTKGMGSLRLPEGSESLVNLLYKDYDTTYQKIDTEGIKALLAAVEAQKPDITVATLHWGSEYNDIVSGSQEKIAKLMQENGVDVILGSHSHYAQSVQYDGESGKLVAWSLGDVYGEGTRAGSQYSVVLELEITRDNATGQTRVTGWDYTPIYTLTPQRDGMDMQVVRLREALALYENNHVYKVTDQAYENMKAALAKLEGKMGK